MVIPVWTMLAAGAVGAHAPAPMVKQGDTETIVSLSTRSCPFRRAREIDLSTLIRDYARLRGRCVAVRGWNLGLSLYPTLADANAGATSAIANRPPHIGIYGPPAALRSLSAEPRRVKVSGIVGACEIINQGAGSFGYCHNIVEGGFLILGAIRGQR